MSSTEPAPSPLRFFETANMYQRSAALKAAVDLDLFTAIASANEGTATSAEIAQRCQASERGVRVLCDYLTVIGFLQKTGNQYRLTPDSATFLDRRSPAYLGSMLDFLLSPHITAPFQDLTAVVRRGGGSESKDGTLAPEHPVWVQFAHAMAPMMSMIARQMLEIVPVPSGEPTKLLDIAAGHGMFGITFAQRYPDIEVTAVDWPNVLEVARQNAEKAGVADRYHTLEGSAFDVEVGDGFDLVFLTNFLHHFDPPTCETLLRKVHAALKAGGRAVTLEFVPNEDRVTPPAAAAFSLQMLAGTPSGDAYTFRELEAMYRSAGFSRSELHPLAPGANSVIISQQ